LLKTGFFRQVRVLKIQRNNQGSALHLLLGNYCIFWGFFSQNT
jgi:hypothetical protein